MFNFIKEGHHNNTTSVIDLLLFQWEGGGGGGAIIKTPPVSDPADTSVSLSVSPFLSPEQPFSCHLGLMRNTVEFHWAGKLNITVSVLLETSHSPQSRLNYSEM